MSRDLLDELDKLAAKATAAGNEGRTHAFFEWLNELAKAYPALAARLRAAEKVCELTHLHMCAHNEDEVGEALEEWKRARSGSETP